MAVRPTYSAEIKFNFKRKDLDASLANIEKMVTTTVKNISSSLSDIKFDIPDIDTSIGKMGGISKVTDKIARQIRSVVRDSFKDIEEVTDIGDIGIDQALEEAADKLGTTADKIVRRLKRMTDESGKEFKRLRETGIRESNALYEALVGRSIFRTLAKESIEVFRRLARVSEDIFTEMSDDGISAFGKGFQDAAKSMRDQESPVDAIEAPRFREEIASIEETLARLPDKSKSSFKLLSRSFGEVRAEAIKTQKQFEQGIVDEESLLSAKEKLDKVGESIAKFKTEELARLRAELKRNADTVSLTERTFGDKMQDIRDGLALTSETGGNKLLSLRVALSGIGEATGPVSKLLDRFTSNLDDVGKAEGRLAEITSKTTKSLSSQNNAIKSSIDAIKQVAKIEGLHAGALNEVDAQVSRVEKAYKDMTTTIEATGKATPQQVARVREEYRLLEQSISLVKTTNKDAIGPDTLSALGDLEQKIKRNVPATRVLAATLGAASEKVDKLKASTDKLGSETQKSTGIFGRFRQTIASLFSFTSKQSSEMNQLRTATASAASTASSAGAVFLGAFGGTLLGSIAGIKSALIGLSESTGSQVEKETKRISAAFGLLPSEANVVSGAIADIYESNLGGSVDEIGEATQRTIARFRELGVTSQDEIAGVTKNAFELSRAYGFDVPDSLDASAVLMKQFNLTTKQSVDFLAGLGKEGVIGSDALDSVLEYATQIKSAGGNADTLFNVIKTGFAGGGTLGTDKAVDLFKEFRLQISSGSDDVKSALDEIGINSTQLLSQMSSGTITATQAFEIVKGKLSEIDDESAVTRLGAELMGVQFEDMGNQMALAVSTVGTTMGDLAGTSDNLATNYTDLGSGIEAINRRMAITFSPLKDAFLDLAQRAIPPILEGIEALRPRIEAISDRIRTLIDAMTGGDWGSARDIIIGAMTEMANGASEILEWLVDAGFDWGANFVLQIADGIISTAVTAIAEAGEFVGDIMKSFWMPGSPPEKGPLSTMDQWGKELMDDVFGPSFKSADFKFVEQATAPIKKHFEDTFGKDGFEAFAGIRGKFTEIVSELNTTGLINEDKFKEISETIGGANTELTKMLGLQLKQKKAQRILADIQKEVSDAESAGFVSKGLKQKLKSAKQEVTLAKENVDWQQEFLKFQKLSRDSFGGVSGSIKNIANAAKSASTGAARSVAGGAAKAASSMANAAKKANKTARVAIDRQTQFLEEGYDKEKGLLKQKLSAGLIDEESYFKGVLKLEEKYVDISLDKGLLSGVELTKWSERINALKKSVKGIKSDSSKITPIGESFLGDDMIKGKVGQNLLTGAKDLGTDIAINVAEGIAESARTRIGAAFVDMGAKISEFFRTKILDKLTTGQKAAGGLIMSALFGVGASVVIAKIAIVASKLSFLSGIALRFLPIGAALYLVWQNWDKIMIAVKSTIGFLSDVWISFSDRLGGSEGTLAIFSGIFNNIKEVLSDIGGNLVEFVLDALEGKSISFSDFIGIFDLSAINTEPITKVITAISDTFREKANEVKLSIFGPDGLIKIGGADEESSRLGRIFANFVSIFDRAKEKVKVIQKAFSEFMAEDRLGGRIAGLINAISESWKALSLVIGGALIATNLPAIIALLSLIVPVLVPVIAIVGIVAIVIGNFEKIWPPLETALGGAVLAVTGIVEAIGGIFLLFDDETRAEGIKLFFSGLVDTIGGLQIVFLGLGVTIATFLLSAVADISGGIASILEAFGLDALAERFRAVEVGFDDIAIKLAESFEKVKVILSGLRDQIKIILPLIAAEFIAWVVGIWTSVTGWFKKLYNDLIGNSIITDMISGITAAFGMEGLVEKVASVIGLIKGAFSSLKTSVSLAMSLLKISVTGKFSAISTFVSEKVEIMKGFVSDVKTFVSGTIDEVSKFKLPTLSDISTAASEVVESISGLSSVDVSAGVASVVTSLSTLATDGIAQVELFASGVLSAITGTDMSESVSTFFAPVLGMISQLETIKELGIGEAIKALFSTWDISSEVATFFAPIQAVIDAISNFDPSSAISSIIPDFSGDAISFEIPDIDTILSPITTAFSALDTATSGSLTNIRAGLSGLFTGLDPATSAVTYGLEAALAMTNIDTSLSVITTSIKDGLGGLFDDHGLAQKGLDLGIEAAVPIAGLASTIMTEAGKVTASLGNMLPGVNLETLSAAAVTIKDSVVSGISTMVTDGIATASQFALDFIAEIMSIPTKIKERIEEFSIGDLIWEKMGFAVNEDMEESGEESIGIADRIVSGITSAWSGGADELVTNSIIPDMNAAIVESFNLMSTDVTESTTLMITTITDQFTLMFETLLLGIEETGEDMVEIIEDANEVIQDGVDDTLDHITDFAKESIKALKSVESTIRSLISALGRLVSKSDSARGALLKLNSVDMSNLGSIFDNLRTTMDTIVQLAIDFRDNMREAESAAANISVNGGGGGASAQHGAWDVPRNQMMFIHKKETVLPPAVAENFRTLMTTLQQAGIGKKTFSIPTGSGNFTGGKTSTTIITNQITAEFPNVGSADDAEDIVTKLNELIDGSRKLALVGS